MNQTTLINLYPNQYSQELHYNPFAVKLDMCAGTCNALDDSSNKGCVPNKTKGLNLHVFNMITEINESRSLTNHISCKYECAFDDRKCNFNQNWNNDKYRCECKNPKEHQCKKGYFWNTAKCNSKNSKHAIGTGDSVVISNEVIEETKAILTKNTSTKFHIFKAFLLTLTPRNTYIYVFSSILWFLEFLNCLLFHLEA